MIQPSDKNSDHFYSNIPQGTVCEKKITQQRIHIAVKNKGFSHLTKNYGLQSY